MKNCIKLSVFLLLVIGFTACSKNGQPEPLGGQLPTRYIIISEAGFSPKEDTAVNGTSFTFINRSGSVKGIYSSDSVVINKQGIADNSSYFFQYMEYQKHHKPLLMLNHSHKLFYIIQYYL